MGARTHHFTTSNNNDAFELETELDWNCEMNLLRRCEWAKKVSSVYLLIPGAESAGGQRQHLALVWCVFLHRLAQKV